jgi:DNA-binding CsgD family transcriptional regulator
LASALCHTRTLAALEQACQRLLAAGASNTQLAELVIEVSCALPFAIGSGDASAPERLRGLIGEVDAKVGERLLTALAWRQPQMTSAAQLHARMVRVSKAGDGPQRTAAVFRAAAETVEVLLDPGLTRQLVQQARDEAEQLGSGAALSLACSVQAVAAARAGDLDAAAELAQAGVDAQETHDVGVREPPLAELVQLLTQLQTESDWSRLAAAAARLANQHRSSPYSVSLMAIAALACARAGDIEEARALLRVVLGALQPVQRYSAAASAAIGPAVEAALGLNDVALGEGLLPVVRRVLEAGGGDFYMSQRDLTLGRLALLLGHADEARTAFERARVALDGAHERTLRGLLDGERQQALAAAFEGSPDSGPGGLTRRQLEVLLLLAEGMTSQQIAERLVVSVNTVNRHVADIYRKIDASNRVGAAAYVARHGLSGLSSHQN